MVWARPARARFLVSEIRTDDPSWGLLLISVIECEQLGQIGPLVLELVDVVG